MKKLDGIEDDFELEEFLDDDILDDEGEREHIDPVWEAFKDLSPFEQIGFSIGRMVRNKNLLYGDSALDPLRIFSPSSPLEGILVRIDDKLSRIKNSETLRKNDITDLMGYLILLCLQKGWTFFEDLED